MGTGLLAAMGSNAVVLCGLRVCFPGLHEAPYKQLTFKEHCRNLLLREGLGYDLYDGENYKAEAYGKNHWEHDPDVQELNMRTWNVRKATCSRSGSWTSPIP